MSNYATAHHAVARTRGSLPAMAQKQKKPKVVPQLEVAIEGAGLSPADVSVRDLAVLLQATASAIEAIAEEQGVEPPTVRLVAVRSGSAAYDLAIPSPDAPAIIRDFYQT